MKTHVFKFFFILLVLIIAFSCKKEKLDNEGALKDPFKNIDSTLQYKFSGNDSVLYGKSYSYYNSENKPLRIEYQYKTENAWRYTKEEYKYDDNGFLTSFIVSQKEDSDWEIIRKTEKQYNFYGKVLVYMGYELNYKTEELILFRKRTSSYNDKNQEIETIEYEWNSETNNVEKLYKLKWSYAKDQRYESALYYWDKDSAKWDLNFEAKITEAQDSIVYDKYKAWYEENKMTITETSVDRFDNENNIITHYEKELGLFDTVFYFTNKDDFQYDNNGNRTYFCDYNWDITFGWVPNYKYENAYDINNNETLDSYSEYDKYLESWTCKDKTESTYNGMGLLEVELSYHYINSLQQLTLVRKTENSYNDMGVLETEILYKYNSTSQQLMKYEKKEILYYKNEKISTILHYQFNEGLNIFEKDTKIFYYY